MSYSIIEQKSYKYRQAMSLCDYLFKLHFDRKWHTQLQNKRSANTNKQCLYLIIFSPYSIMEKKSYKYQQAMSVFDNLLDHCSYLIVYSEGKIE
jgi:hypothetical protein